MRGEESSQVECKVVTFSSALSSYRGLYTLRRTVIQQTFRHTTGCCYWPIAYKNQERHLDEVRFLPCGATMCWMPCSVVCYKYTVATRVCTGIMLRVIAFHDVCSRSRCAHDIASFPLVIPPCVASSSLIGTEKERTHSKCTTNPCNSART